MKSKRWLKNYTKNHLRLFLIFRHSPSGFSFSYIRALRRHEGIRDLLVTYTCPKEYQSEDKLSEGAENWDYLPGFLGTEKSEVLIAAVGFMVESLQDHLSSNAAHPAVQLLIPFPAPPSATRRSWESVFKLQSARNSEKFVKHRLDANDMSAAFNRISSRWGEVWMRLLLHHLAQNRSQQQCVFMPISSTPPSTILNHTAITPIIRWVLPL